MATDSPLTSGVRRALRLGSEPAMPVAEVGFDRVGGHETRFDHLGLSKRVEFAKAAMQGLLAIGGDCSIEGIARLSVRYADALLEELAK